MLVKNDNGSGVDAGTDVTWSFSDEAGAGVPWGPHELPLSLELEGVSIKVDGAKGRYAYRREGAGDSIGKQILAENSKIKLSPAEPLNKPSPVCANLLIELSSPAVIQPKSAQTLYLAFPVEIAVLLEHGRSEDYLLDIFSLVKAKYTLYGGVKEGMVCRHWASEVYTEIPNLNPLEQGVLKLTVSNLGNRWAELNKAVFSAYGMKLFYGPGIVSLTAEIKIINETFAETSFKEGPLQDGMARGIELYSAKPLSQQGKIVMEEGY